MEIIVFTVKAVIMTILLLHKKKFYLIEQGQTFLLNEQYQEKIRQ